MSDSEKEVTDEDNEYITKDELIIELNYLIELVKTKKYTRSHLQDIHDSLEEYITGESAKLDPVVIEYVIRGWWLTESIKKINNNETPKDMCPLCIRTIKNDKE